GVVFCARRSWPSLTEHYLALRPKLVDRLGDCSFAGQVALALAIAGARVPARALPIRYNFPNDARAVTLHPGEPDDVRIFHYLRTGLYDRHRIFSGAAEYRYFLQQPLSGVDRVFQQKIEAMFGREYPFALGEDGSLVASPTGGALSRAAYDAAVLDHAVAAAPALEENEAQTISSVLQSASRSS
ncbi:MAG: hypothetical protein JO213_05460, partial [Alphaproteobacteria bacterium]|nr:hypothetical protein [Alphaproteobacteria bacterium]